MLVKFSSPADASILMLGDPARTLLEMMGQSGNIPGALSEEDVSAALGRLLTALNAKPPNPDRDGNEGPAGNGPIDPAVGIQVRAYPLVRLLERAIAEKAPVVWESS